MKKVIVIMSALFLLSQVSFSQTFELTVQNQQVNGTEFTFDIYMLRTGATNVYLGQTDLVLTYNQNNFSSDLFTLVEQGDGSNRLSNDLLYTYGVSIVSPNRLVVNIDPPTVTTQTHFDTRVQVISNTGLGEKIGTFKITTISVPTGTSGLQWRTSGANSTIVRSFSPTSPWPSSNISANGTYSNPGDVSLPVELTAFSATPEADKIVLKWTTQSEVNNLGFEVYRSGEETGAYAMIASFENTPALQGGGNSNTAREYTYEDAILSNGGTYWYQIADVDYQGVRTFHGPVSAQAPDLIPEAYALRPNYPNPFNPETTIRFEVPADPASNGKIALAIYNNLGMVVRTLVSGSVQPGIHTVKWDGRNDRGDQMASGVYFLRLQAGSFVQTQKMLLVR